MVVSFKISRNGTRYRPKPKPDPHSGAELGDDEVDVPLHVAKIQSPTARKRSVDVTDEDHSVAENLDGEVSFILNIFSDGYRIVPYEQDALHDGSKSLCPYDRRSESLITAIELGRLPVDFLDDIPCKYINGTVICEVRDYRKESSESEVNDSLIADFPSITKVSLKMSLDVDDVVKDINLISDSRWDYGDLLEAESRILLALHPKLCLDPTPNLERLCKDPRSIKLNLDIRGKRLKRLRQLSDSKNSNSSVRASGKVTSQPVLGGSGSSSSVGNIIGQTQSLAFSSIESAQQEQMAVNQRLNTLQMTNVLGGSGSSSSVGNIIGPVTANSSVDRSTQIQFFENPNGDLQMLGDPTRKVQSTDGQLRTTGVFTNSCVQQSLNNRESQLRDRWSYPYNRETELRILLLQSQTQRKMMGGDGSVVMGPNPMATRLGMGQCQSSSVGRLQSANREMQPGSVLGSGSIGGLMLGSSVGAGICSNMASGMSQMQRNVKAPPNLLRGSSHNRNHYINRNHYMNQQWHLKATPQHIDSPSSSSRRLDEQIGPYQLIVNQQTDSQNMNVSRVGLYHRTPVSQNPSSQHMNVLPVGSSQGTSASPHMASPNMDFTDDLIGQLLGVNLRTKRG